MISKKKKNKWIKNRETKTLNFFQQIKNKKKEQKTKLKHNKSNLPKSTLLHNSNVTI